jgi:CheY-like chemotaxis protein
VVDDEPDARFLLRYAFERAGHEVLEASNGKAALEAVQTSCPALVVTDMMMPIMGGHEMIKRLRSIPGGARIPVISVSGNPELATDADLALNKFGDLSELIPMAEKLLEKGRAAE